MSTWPHKKDEISFCIFNLIMNSKSNSNSKTVDPSRYAAKKFVDEEAVESSDEDSNSNPEKEEDNDDPTDAEDEEKEEEEETDDEQQF
jgi:hypothetical protein